VRQVFIGRGPETVDENEFERKLYVIRKRAYNEIRVSTIGGAEFWYVVSLSHKTMVYKGMLTTMQLDQYFLDLQNPLMESAIALVHSRFSTNTFPSWDRAHPYRCIAHNGEINTLRGNINWMRAREALFQSPVFGDDIRKIPPIVNPNGSDSSMFDNVLELMVLSGRSMPHAVMMMIPEPWSKHASMDPARRAFYQYHSSLMEPWDGPADISFTDGKRIGAVLDRNGLRPGRYYVTKDDLCVMASRSRRAGISRPSRSCARAACSRAACSWWTPSLAASSRTRRSRRRSSTSVPYAEWLKQYLVHLKDLPAAPELPAPEPVALAKRQVAFGYTFEDQRILMAPMARDGVEAVGSMGNDTPLAALSSKSRLLYDYFKQLFAQVTNPPIDCIREEIITSSDVWLGSEGNLLDPRPSDCRRLELPGPVLTNEEFAKVRRISLPGLKVGTLSMLFRADRGEDGLVEAIEHLRARRGA
jgi:glutamate synthase (ferredoxin)